LHKISESKVFSSTTLLKILIDDLYPNYYLELVSTFYLVRFTALQYGSGFQVLLLSARKIAIQGEAGVQEKSEQSRSFRFRQRNAQKGDFSFAAAVMKQGEALVLFSSFYSVVISRNITEIISVQVLRSASNKIGKSIFRPVAQLLSVIISLGSFIKWSNISNMRFEFINSDLD